MNRRTFGARLALGVAGLGMLACAGEQAGAQVVWNTKEWNSSVFERLLRDDAPVKQLFDIVPVESGKPLQQIANSINGLQVGFGIAANQIRVAAALHGAANMLCFGDALWSKYKVGEWFGIDDPATGKPAVRNPFYASTQPDTAQLATGDPGDLQSAWHDSSMAGLQRRGVQFLGCHTALEFQIRELIAKRSLTASPETVVEEFLGQLQPGVVMTPAIGAAMALLQGKGRFTYLKVG